jgi:hypothetical protein
LLEEHFFSRLAAITSVEKSELIRDIIGVLRRGLLLQLTADFDIKMYGNTISLNILHVVRAFELLVDMDCCIATCFGLLYSGNEVRGFYWNQRVCRSH